MTDLEKLRLLDILLKEFEILDYVNETQFDVELDDDDRRLINKILKERGYKVFDDEDDWEKIKEIKSSLPQELVLVITCDCAPEYVEDEIADAISEETGWLINSFTYDIISETEIEEEE